MISLRRGRGAAPRSPVTSVPRDRFMGLGGSAARSTYVPRESALKEKAPSGPLTVVAASKSNGNSSRFGHRNVTLTPAAGPFGPWIVPRRRTPDAGVSWKFRPVRSSPGATVTIPASSGKFGEA